MADTPPNAATPQQMSRRRIASLPVRPKTSSGHPESSPRSSGHRTLTPEPALRSTQSLQGPSNDRDLSYQFDDSTDHSHLSPPRASPHPPSFHFGRSDIESQPDEQNIFFTFRSLHNVTPIPLSPEPPKPNPTAPDFYPTCLSFPSRPFISTAAHELPQALHMYYSNEKIPISSEDNLPEVTNNLTPSTSSNFAAGECASPSLIKVNTAFSASELPELNTSSKTTSAQAFDQFAMSPTERMGVPYDVMSETSPPEPFFTPAFQTALQSGLAVAKSAATAVQGVLGALGFRDDLDRLLKSAEDLSRFESSDTRTIAVLGDSGHGNGYPCKM